VEQCRRGLAIGLTTTRRRTPPPWLMSWRRVGTVQAAAHGGDDIPRSRIIE
jgi:hypothetical protein